MSRKYSINGISLIVIGIFITVLVLCGINLNDKSKGLVISEICTNNKRVVYDIDGNYDVDYIELYNDSQERIELLGYGLSDDEDAPYRYTFPEIGLDPDECIILWGREPLGEETLSLFRDGYEPPLMLGFKLKAGEVLTLTNPDGKMLCRVAIPEMGEDRVFEVAREDMGTYYIGNPTPGYIGSKSEVLYREIGIMNNDVPIASRKSGFYDDSFDVELQSYGGDIYYTMDGSKPDIHSFLYTDPITISDRTSEENLYSAICDFSIINPYVPKFLVDKCTVLRAVAIDEDGNESSEMTEVYFVGYSGRYGYEGISVMSITSDPEGLFSDEHGIFVLGNVYRNYIDRYSEPPDNQHEFEANYNRRGIGWERSAVMHYFDENHNLILTQDIGIRIHGNWSRAYNQKGINLYAREDYGEPYFVCDFFDNDKQYDELMLRQGDMYLSRIRDVLAQNLVSDRKVGWEMSKPCMVFLDGEFWGVYNLQEKVSECWIENEYGILPDEQCILKNGRFNGNGEQTIKDQEDWQKLILFITTEDMSNEDNYAEVCQYIDIDNWIDYYCIESYLANFDFVNNNNNSCWKSRIQDSKNDYMDERWRMLLFDLDSCMGAWDMSTYNFDSFLFNIYNVSVFSSLLSNPEFKEKFVITFMDLANENFKYDKVHKQIGRLSDIYEDSVVITQQRWRGEYKSIDEDYDGWYTIDDFENNVDIIDDFFKYRYDCITEYMKQDLALEGDLMSICLSAQEGVSNVRLNSLSFDNAINKWEGKYYSDYPIHLTVETDSGKEFVGWNINGKLVSSNAVIDIDLNEYLGNSETVNIELIVQ